MRTHYRYYSGLTKTSSRTKRIVARASASAAALFAAAGIIASQGAGAAVAANQVVVTPTNTQGWTTADTRPGGEVTFVVDPTAPGSPNAGALQLTTDATTAAKAQYMHDANTPLADVTELSYSTKQNAALFPQGEASYQLVVCLSGEPTATTCPGFTTFVYEPYQNGVPVTNTWQSWDVDSGQFWSSRTVTDGTCAVVAGSGGAPFYNLASLKLACPDAVVVGFGVNIGSFNPGYDVEADLVNFNGTTYNFEPFQTVSNKDQCKKGGYVNFTDANGMPFKNQGQCVAYSNHN